MQWTISRSLLTHALQLNEWDTKLSASHKNLKGCSYFFPRLSWRKISRRLCQKKLEVAARKLVTSFILAASLSCTEICLCVCLPGLEPSACLFLYICFEICPPFGFLWMLFCLPWSSWIQPLSTEGKYLVLGFCVRNVDCEFSGTRPTPDKILHVYSMSTWIHNLPLAIHIELVKKTQIQ